MLYAGLGVNFIYFGKVYLSDHSALFVYLFPDNTKVGKVSASEWMICLADWKIGTCLARSLREEQGLVPTSAHLDEALED